MMSRPACRILLASVAVVAAATTTVRADVVSSFDANAEGWSVVSFNNLSANNYGVMGTYPVTYNAIGGNPGGYISSTDPDVGDFTFSAPAAFLGDVSAQKRLSYDLIYQQGATNYHTTDVLLLGNGTRLLWRSSPDIVPGPSWMSAVADFTPSSNWHVGVTTGPIPTPADFQGVLGNLTGLYIRGEFDASLPAELTGIDNVRLSAVPEPGSMTLLLVVGLVPALTRRRGTIIRTGRGRPRANGTTIGPAAAHRDVQS